MLRQSRHWHLGNFRETTKMGQDDQNTTQQPKDPQHHLGSPARVFAATEPLKRAGILSSTIKDINRFRQIITLLTKHGFAQMIKRTGLYNIIPGNFSIPDQDEEINPEDPGGTARRLRIVLEELGTTFIKLGQILSTRPDLLPNAYILEFSRLQDRVPPMPTEEVKAQIEAAFGQNVDTLFKQFETTPLATASIGQVHAAQTLEGKSVVVKVRRVGVEEQIRSDLDILFFMAKLLEATIQEMKIYSIVEIIKEFDRAITQEIDFLNEAKNIQLFQRNFQDNPHVKIPEAILGLSTTSVLTLERFEGKKFSDLNPDDPASVKLVNLLLEATYSQIFEHGLFHADPHPGNIFILGPETIGLIDFGLVGRLSRTQQEDLITLLVTILSEDIDGTARALLRMGYPQGRVDLAAFKREIAKTRDRYINQNLHQIDIGAFSAQVMDAAIRYQVKLNSEYSLLVKTIITLEGVLRESHPNLDLIKTASPFAKRLILERYSSKRILQNILSGAMNLSGFLRDIPAQLDQVLMDLETGAVRVQIQHNELKDLGTNFNVLGIRIALGLITCGLIIGSAILIAQYDWRPRNIPILAIIAIMALISSFTTGFLAIAWPYLKPKLRRLRIRPIIKFFRR